MIDRMSFARKQQSLYFYYILGEISTLSSFSVMKTGFRSEEERMKDDIRNAIESGTMKMTDELRKFLEG